MTPLSAGADNVLEARGISKSFLGVRALQGVDLIVRRGRLNALLGENGAGKSTLMNILAGVFPPDEGEIRLERRAVAFANPRQAQEAGVAIIFQELNNLQNLSVAENMFIGREPVSRLGWIDYGTMRREAAILLAQLELDADPQAPMNRLRIGQRQIVEIAKALSLSARVIIMDEPTSALTEQEAKILRRVIGDLKNRGIGIIYITHRLDELESMADDVTIFRDGRLIESCPFASITREEIIRRMVGRDLMGRGARGARPAGETALEVENLSLPHPERPGDFLIENVSFALKRGEVLGIFGLMGAGRTELLETLFGQHAETSRGSVKIDGKRVQRDSPREAIRAGLALAPEDRKRDGLVLSMSVAENISLASPAQIERFGMIQPAVEHELASRFVQRLSIKTPSTNQAVRKLSGGNQQKTVLAKWMLTRPKVLLLDEPTRGIDVQAKQEIYALIDRLVHEGLGVVLVSSELPEILAVADRILVLCEGRLTGEFAGDAATEENILRAALPRRDS